MKIITGGLEYPVAAIPSLGERTVRLPLEEVPEAIGETVALVDNDGAELCPPWTVADWLRCYLDGNTLVLTQTPEPPPPPEPTAAELAAAVRAKRDELLRATDWTQTLDSPVEEPLLEAYRVYRQALRDVPEQAGFPADVIWPELPTVTKAAPVGQGDEEAVT